ncbi:small GTP-binding protein [Histomonas meleagridis]|uniref:small GTP-binding protein n=1 Tax=Histomonas meleagridis TaxID=135588 RepID=UPI003559640B|nr:small GTP-binding protein [Histomonas meleagridis]KAH0800634.1 small GTP-binding protein [Histomonas meleagridis]
MTKNYEAKVVFIGMSGVGKTSIISRIGSGVFDPNQLPTIGASFTAKTIQKEQGNVTLRIWDTAGQERFRSLAPMYYQGSQACLIVFALNSKDSFNDAQVWYDEMERSIGEKTLLYLIGNKADLTSERTVTIEEANNKADSMGAVYFEVSAQTGQNIEDLVEDIAFQLLSKDISLDTNNLNPVLKDEDDEDQKKCGC